MRLTFLLIAFSGFLSIGAQATGGGDAASVTLDVVTSFGEPVKFMVVRIDSADGSQTPLHKVIKFHGRTLFGLRRGMYRFSCEQLGDTWPIERTVDIIADRAYVLLAVARKESFAISGEGGVPAYTVEGTIVQNGSHQRSLFVRMRGAYLSTAAEAQIDTSGHFRVAVPFQGDYEVEVVGAGSVVAHKPVRFDESTGQRMRMNLSIP